MSFLLCLVLLFNQFLFYISYFLYSSFDLQSCFALGYKPLVSKGSHLDVLSNYQIVHILQFFRYSNCLKVGLFSAQLRKNKLISASSSRWFNSKHKKILSTCLDTPCHGSKNFISWLEIPSSLLNLARTIRQQSGVVNPSSIVFLTLASSQKRVKISILYFLNTKVWHVIYFWSISVIIGVVQFINGSL